MPDKLKKWIWEWVDTLVVAFVLAILIRSFFLQVFWIPSESMQPTLNVNDRIVVNKIAYGLPNPLFDSFKEKTFLYIIPNPFYKRPVFLSDWQYLIPWNNNPNRFDIVVFRTYNYNDDRKDLIKRVIGLPGETIELKKGVVLINRKPLNETHMMNNGYYNFDVKPATYGPITIPSDCYFVMGDNRPNSADSRYIGVIPKRYIVGPAFIRIWPIWQLHLI